MIRIAIMPVFFQVIPSFGMMNANEFKYVANNGEATG